MIISGRIVEWYLVADLEVSLLIISEVNYSTCIANDHDHQ